MRPPELEAIVRRRAMEAERAMQGEVERILAIADPTARMRAYAELRRTMDDGEALPAEAERRVVQSLQADTAPAGMEAGRAMATTWDVERRRMALVFTLRPVAAAGCAVAALAPFVVAAWRWGWGIGDALAAFLTPGWPLAGVALAAVAAGVMARLPGRADTLEGLAWPVVGSGLASVVGLALTTAG